MFFKIMFFKKKDVIIQHLFLNIIYLFLTFF